MHTFITFQLIATGMLLTSQQADALGWGSPERSKPANGPPRGEISSYQNERDIGILEDLAAGGALTRQDLLNLDADQSNFDCHQKIRQRIALHCAADHTESKSARWDQGERAGVAIALTLCSIKSALQSPPIECEAWSPFPPADTSPFGEGQEQMSSFPKDDEEGRGKRGRCLEALHRSPQDWSSYNGYLSDAAKQCHILKGQQTLDLARGIYVNSTLEKLAFIRMLKDHELARRQGEDEIEKGWLNKVDALQEIAGEFDRNIHRFDIDLARGDQALKAQLEILGDITREALSNKEEFWKVAGDSMEVVMQETAKGLSEVITAGSTRPLKDLAARLEDIVEAHKSTIQEQDHAQGSMITQYVSSLEERTLRAYDLDKERMDEAAVRWSMLQTTLDVTGKELDLIVTRLRELDPALTNALEVAVKFKDVSLDHLAQSRSITQDLQVSLSGSLSMAQDEREVWKGIKHDLDDERNVLEIRKTGRSKGALSAVFNVLTHYLFPNPLEYPLVQFILNTIGRYPSILPFLQVGKMVVHLAFDGLYWMFWVTTWAYVLLQTGMWRMTRVLHKCIRNVYDQLHETSSGLEDGKVKQNGAGWVSDGRRKTNLWELPFTPESTPRKPVPTQRRTQSRQHEGDGWKGFVPTAQTTGALGLIIEDKEDVFGTTRLAGRPERARGGRKHSLAAQVDRMKRRAQSEPLL